METDWMRCSAPGRLVVLARLRGRPWRIAGQRFTAHGHWVFRLQLGPLLLTARRSVPC